jgi:hypothetical protein
MPALTITIPAAGDLQGHPWDGENGATVNRTLVIPLELIEGIEVH